MFHDLDSTIAELLKRDLPSMVVEQVGITFATPDDDFPSMSVTLPAINLFLYDFQDNRQLRNAEHPIEWGANGKGPRARPPVTIDCRYLVTAWAKAGVLLPEQDEHRLLGDVMCVLARYREIPRELLQGSMQRQPLPPRGIVLPVTHEQQRSRGEFWQALGGKPKAAFDYLVTISLEVGVPEEVVQVAAIAHEVRPPSGGSASP